MEIGVGASFSFQASQSHPRSMGNLRLWPGLATDRCVTLSKSFLSLNRFLVRKTGGPPSCRELCPGSFYVSFSSGCHRPGGAQSLRAHRLPGGGGEGAGPGPRGYRCQVSGGGGPSCMARTRMRAHTRTRNTPPAAHCASRRFQSRRKPSFPSSRWALRPHNYPGFHSI